MSVDVHWQQMCRAPRAKGGELFIAMMWMLRTLVLAEDESMNHETCSIMFHHFATCKWLNIRRVGGTT